MLKLLRPLIAATACIIITLIAVSIVDIFISVLFSRFYSSVAFIVTFGIGGMFAAVLAYMYAKDQMTNRDEMSRWMIILWIILAGILFFFPFANLEGGEYASAFKAYGATLALGSLLFVNDNS
jgi:hypothetical protein